jgi:transcriptional regulator with PAS, ATPase and Fis domain
VQAAGSEQAQLLLDNGVEPDLVILESSQSEDVSGFVSVLRTSSNATVCLLHGAGEQCARRQAVGFGVKLFLEKPLVEGEILSMLDQVHNPWLTAPVQGCEGSNLSEPDRVNWQTSRKILEELGDGRYFLAATPSMLKIYRQVRLLAEVDAPVLILGESGTGKEVIAHLVHKHSRRSQHDFVNVNCAALPADLLESELFGYRQGAFTGAIKDKPGKFEQAHRGTLLLDEIGEMSAQMQAKLLHVLQDGQYNRLGARESSRVDVRVLAATNVQIEDALLGKTFREDLFYRLNVFTINVPPLRERCDEIPYLIEETIRRLPDALRKGCESAFPTRLMDAALLYDWRGNVRELRNFVTRTITMRDSDTAVLELENRIASEIQPVREEHSRAVHLQKTGMRSVVRDMTDRAESQMIRDALEASGWNRRHAAKYLDISYRGLLYKIQQHGLAPRYPSLNRP